MLYVTICPCLRLQAASGLYSISDRCKGGSKAVGSPSNIAWLGGDIFVEVLRSLHHTDTDIMRGLIRSTLETLMIDREDICLAEARSNGW